MHFVSWRKRALPSPPTPMMSSKTTFPHRIGGSRHKFPENSQPILPPPTPPPHPSTGQPLTSCLKNRHFYNFFHPPISVNHRDRCQTFWAVAFLVLGGEKAIGSRSWRWWRRRSKPCSNKLMRRRSVSWRYKGSWTVSWNCAKKWEKSRICSPFPFFREKKNHLLFPEILILVMF